MTSKAVWFTPLVVSVTFVEWVEYALYMYLGPTLSAVFFPQHDPQLALLMTYGLFAAAYLTRPIGGLLFGFWADTRGRRPPMIVNCVLLGMATCGIGLLPSYAQIGYLAPLGLLMLRLVQSMAVAGEFNNAAILLMEHAQRRVTLAGSWVGSAAAAGMFVGGLFAAVEPTHWRWPFLCVGLGAMALMLLRRHLIESPQFSALSRQRSVVNPLRAMWHFPRALWHIAAVAIFLNVFVYTCSVYLVSFMVLYGGIANSRAALLLSMTQLAVAVTIPVCAWLAERSDYRRLFCAGAGLMMLVAPCLFFVVWQRYALGYISVVLLGYVIADAAVSASIFRFMFVALPAEVRCTATSTIWGLCAALFGATAPLLAAYCVARGWVYAPAAYVAFTALVALLVVRRSAGPLTDSCALEFTRNK